MPHLRVIRPGMLTTVQDLGRWGLQDRGVPVAGPMDEYSHRRASRMVGNVDDEPALEVTLIGPELESDGPLTCAVAGAVFEVTVDGIPIETARPFAAPSGARIRFGRRLAGARATLAVAGGLLVDAAFGSRATSLSARMGGLGGRALQRADVLPLAPAAARHAAPVGGPLPLPRGGARLRVIPGPHDDRFGRGAFDVLYGERFAVTPDSNRMGYRLGGPPLEATAHDELLSDATPNGSLQVVPSGQVILLMADRQTTGGYPRIGTVISADLPLAAQLAPGDWIAFAPCTRADATAALRAQRAALEGRS